MSAIPGNLPPYQPPAQGVAQIQYNRYVEMLPDSTDHDWWSWAWNATSIAIVAAFLVLTVAVMIFTGLSTPIYLPIAAMSIFMASPHVYNGFSYTQFQSHNEASLAEVEQGVAAQLTQLPDDEHRLVTNFFQAHNIRLEQIHGYHDNVVPRLAILRPVIARYLFWSMRIQTCEQRARDLLQNVQPEQLVEKQLAAMRALESAQYAKAYAAYFRGVILNPLLQGDWKDIFTLNAQPIEFQLMKSALAAQFNAAPAHFIVSRDESVKYTVQQLIQKNDAELCNEIFHVVEV